MYKVLKPREITTVYYTAFYRGDLQTVKDLMTQESYYMTLEAFGLGLSFRDLEFKAALKKIRQNFTALLYVEKKLSSELKAKKHAPKIEIKSVKSNGDKRQTIFYTEDGQDKQLYFSKEQHRWKINYYAGSKVD